MKTLNDIEKEYSEFNIRIDTITSFEEFETWIQIAFMDIKENIKVLTMDYKNNRNAKILGSIRNLLPFLYEYEDTSFYDKDNEYVEEAFLLNKLYENYFKQIYYYSSNYNYNEMAKLADFMMVYYDRNTDYIYGKRDELEYTKRGYSCFNNKDEDNVEVLHEFFINKINEFKELKGIEKVYKM